MSFLAQHPRVAELLLSLAILLASYLGARLLSFPFARVLTRAAAKTATTIDDRLPTRRVLHEGGGPPERAARV